jgi:hypothetical protein
LSFRGESEERNKKRGWGGHCGNQKVFPHHNYVAIEFGHHLISPTKFDRHWKTKFGHHPITPTKFGFEQGLYDLVVVDGSSGIFLSSSKDRQMATKFVSTIIMFF